MIRIDKDYIIGIRREIHQYPEVGFELPITVALVKRELDKMGIGYTEEYGKSSVVATIHPEKEHFTIGIRADMDALLMQEKTNVPFKSKIEGQMHACGHDAHTAMLLGTAKALKEMENEIDCRVKLLFQPSEEGPKSGSEMMVSHGVMDDIDVLIGQHVENTLDVGTVGVCKGASMASARLIKIEFFGRAAHATLPHTGVDALAAAVKTYNNIQFMLTREMNPFEKYICSVGKLSAGTTQNVIADYAEMLLSVRAYSKEVDALIARRIDKIAQDAADELGAEVKVDNRLHCPAVYNNPYISDLVLSAAEKVVGKENIADMPAKMSSEDFSIYLTKKPGVLFRVGTRNEAKGITAMLHNNDFDLDESGLAIGSRVCVQFVLDHMHGINFGKVKESDERK